MGSVFKKTFTKPLPEGAEIAIRNGQQIARWKDAKGKTRNAPVTTGNSGGTRIRVLAATYTAKYRDGSGIVREYPTKCKDKTAAEQVLKGLELRADKVRAGIRTSAEDAVVDHRSTMLEKHLQDYEAYLVAAGTSHAYRANTLRQLRRLATECNFNQLGALDAAPVERWLAAQTKSGMAAQLATLTAPIC